MVPMSHGQGDGVVVKPGGFGALERYLIKVGHVGHCVAWLFLRQHCRYFGDVEIDCAYRIPTLELLKVQQLDRLRGAADCQTGGASGVGPGI